MKRHEEGATSQKSPDIAIYSGGMHDHHAGKFLAWCRKTTTADVGTIILSTRGGAADVAYRISRALQKKYKHVKVVIPWICKSAGTLLCIGAHELCFGENGELGPLDVQVPRKDELFSFASGLMPLQSLFVLRDEELALFETVFFSLISKSNGQISTSRASKIATKLTMGLLGNIYEQIDPMQLGQATRDMSIAKEYGERLDAVAQNLKQGALNKLLMDYPEHGFVIDEDESRELFCKVNKMDESLKELVEQHLQKIIEAIDSENSYFIAYNDFKNIQEQTNGNYTVRDGGFKEESTTESESPILF